MERSLVTPVFKSPPCSFSYLLAYLLGVSERGLATYEEEYKLTIRGTMFGESEQLIRAAMRVRSSLLRHYGILEGFTILDKAFIAIDEATSDYVIYESPETGFLKDIQKLKEHNIDLKLHFARGGKYLDIFTGLQMDISPYIFSSMSNKTNIVEKYKMPAKLIGLFNFRPKSMKELEQLVGNVQNGLNYISGQFICDDTCKLTQEEMSIVLDSDANLFKLLMKITEPSLIPRIDWAKHGGLVRTSNEIYDEVIDSFKNTRIFVDCDNMDVTLFASFVGKLTRRFMRSTEETKPKLVLFIDPETNHQWKTLGVMSGTDLHIEKRDLERLKGEKSVADIAIAVEVTKYVTETDKPRVCLISSDSDFFALLSSLQGTDATFNIGLKPTHTGEMYKKYLEDNKIPHFWLTDYVEPEDRLDVIYRTLCSTVVGYLKRMEVGKWRKDNLHSYISDLIKSKKSVYKDVTEDDISTIVDRFVKEIKVVMPNNAGDLTEYTIREVNEEDK